jgi:predicted lipoprotein with Yx(FWY)xxD motif
MAAAIVLCGLAAAAAVGRAQPITAGDVLSSRQGRTLYVFDNDVVGAGRSVCNGACANVFPPYLVEEGAAVAEPVGVARRDDGTAQWTYKGRPLYLFYADEKRGDANGDGMNRGTWHVARP